MRLILEPQIRFEHSYSGTLTVLEGAELSKLIKSFLRHFKKEAKGANDFWEILLFTVLRSYISVHGKEVVSELLDVLEDTGSPDIDADARKLDLFYRGMLRLMAEVAYPDENWETVFEEPKSHKDIASKIKSTKPSSFESGLDLNNLIKLIQDRLKSAQN